MAHSVKSKVFGTDMFWQGKDESCTDMEVAQIWKLHRYGSLKKCLYWPPNPYTYVKSVSAQILRINYCLFASTSKLSSLSLCKCNFCLKIFFVFKFNPLLDSNNENISIVNKYY